LLGALRRRSASRGPVRFVARLRELALLLAGRSAAAVGAMAVPSGGGIAWVENARGLLIHRLRLDQGRTAEYRIVAPTEWNFHPAGALALALADSPASDLDAVRRRTTMLVNSLDPCVACHVEFDDA
jgi:Ni,Fe-hydrogenase I large subunit